MLGKDADLKAFEYLKSKTVVCSTRIEPPIHPNGGEKILIDFGMYPEKFKKDNRVQYREKCFLWIIDQNSLKIAREKIRNEKRAHDSDYICHTNLSNCGLAYIGGEMLFGEDGNIYLNFFSDRYGNPSQELWEATKKVFVELGYVNIVDILELINKK
jgi:hypothetical protein